MPIQSAHDINGELTITGDLFVGGAIHQTNDDGSDAPTAAAGVAGGSSPPDPVVGTGATDIIGYMTFGTGTTATTGAAVAVTFGKVRPAAPKMVHIQPYNNASQALGLFPASLLSTGFTVSQHTAGSDSQANTVYGFWYHCIF